MPFFERLVDEFYDGVADDEVLLPLYPEQPDLTGARHRLTLFLAQYWGGPRTVRRRAWSSPKLRMRHMPFTVGPLERDRWLQHMTAAVDASTDDPDVREALIAYFVPAAEHMRNDTGLPISSSPRSASRRQRVAGDRGRGRDVQRVDARRPSGSARARRRLRSAGSPRPAPLGTDASDRSARSSTPLRTSRSDRHVDVADRSPVGVSATTVKPAAASCASVVGTSSRPGVGERDGVPHRDAQRTARQRIGARAVEDETVPTRARRRCGRSRRCSPGCRPPRRARDESPSAASSATDGRGGRWKSATTSLGTPRLRDQLADLARRRRRPVRAPASRLGDRMADGPRRRARRPACSRRRAPARRRDRPRRGTARRRRRRAAAAGSTARARSAGTRRAAGRPGSSIGISRHRQKCQG